MGAEIGNCNSLMVFDRDDNILAYQNLAACLRSLVAVRSAGDLVVVTSDVNRTLLTLLSWIDAHEYLSHIENQSHLPGVMEASEIRLIVPVNVLLQDVFKVNL